MVGSLEHESFLEVSCPTCLHAVLVPIQAWVDVQWVTTLTFRNGTKPNNPLWAEILEAEFKRRHGLDSGKYDFSDLGFTS